MAVATLPTLEEIRAIPEIRMAAHKAVIERCFTDPEPGVHPWDAARTVGFRYHVCRVMKYDGTRGLTLEEWELAKKWKAEHGKIPKKYRKHPDFTHRAYDEMFADFDEAIRALEERRTFDFMLLASRFSGKSTVVALFIHYIGLRFPDIAMLLLADTETVGTSFIDKMVRPWMCGNSEGYLEEVFGPEGYLVPEDQWGKWGKTTELNFPKRKTTRRDPTIRICGLNQDFTGKHPDLVIGEDLVNLRTTKTQAAKLDVKNTWHATKYLFPPVRIDVGTIWTDDDLHNERVKDEKERAKRGLPPDVRIRMMPARQYREVWVTHEDGTRERVEEYDENCPPRFDHLDDEELKRLKSSDEMGTNLYPGQMDLNPLPLGHMMFNAEMFKPHFWLPEEVFDIPTSLAKARFDRVKAECKVKIHFTVAVFSDLAGSTDDGIDRSAHLVVAVDPRRHTYVLDGCTGRFMPEENLRIMSEYQHRYNAIFVGCEGGVLRTVYGPSAKVWNTQHPDRPIHFRKVESGGRRGGSNDRALRLQPPAKRGEIHLHREQTELLEQLCRYSGIDNSIDDYVAALALAYWNPIAGSSPPEDEKPKDYEEELLDEMEKRAFEKCRSAWEGVESEYEVALAA